MINFVVHLEAAERFGSVIYPVAPGFVVLADSAVGHSAFDLFSSIPSSGIFSLGSKL